MIFIVVRDGVNKTLTGQLGLFDNIPPKPGTPTVVEKDEAEGYAFIYIATKSGGGQVLMVMSIEDAKKLCSHKSSKGTILGGQWMYCWTSVENYRKFSPVFEFSGSRMRADNGSRDGLFEKIGITKIPITRELLERFGFEVK
jgi:hypothetical protein